MGEAAWHVPLARGHVVHGAVHEEGCATAAHILQRRYFPLPLSTHPITTSCFPAAMHHLLSVSYS